MIIAFIKGVDIMKKIKNLIIPFLVISFSAGLISCKKKEKEKPVVMYTVSFYNGTELFESETINENDTAIAPSDHPEKVDYEFAGWYVDESYETLYDFATPVTSDLSLYAGFVPYEYFREFDERFISHYSPFVSETTVYSDDVDPTLVFSCSSLEISPVLNTSFFKPFGAFSGLTVKEVEVANKVVTLKTEGEVAQGTGYIAFDKRATVQEEFFVSTFDVVRREVVVDDSSIRVDYEGKAIRFVADIYGDTLLKDKDLSLEDFLNQLKNSGHITIDHNDKFSLSLEGITEDLTCLSLKVTCVDAINLDTANLLKEAKITFEEELFTSGQGYEEHLDLTEISTTSNIKVAQKDVSTYEGTFDIHLNNARFSDYFKTKVSEMLQNDHNKNLILKLSGYDIVVNSLNYKNNQNITGEFTINSESILEGDIKIDLSPVVLSDEDTVVLTKAFFDETTVTVPNESVSYEVLSDLNPGVTLDSVTQQYHGTMTVIEASTFGHPDGLDDVIRVATSLGKIGVGVCSKNPTSVMYGLGGLLDIDSLKDPTVRILNRLQGIIDELGSISTKLENISTQLNAIEDELRTYGKEAVLTNFLTAQGLFNQFIADYYVPLTNIVNAYTDTYFRYFYDFAMQTFQKNKATDVKVTLHYDIDGELAFPDEYGTHSLDGRIIDQNATREVPIYELSSALAGIRANEGHSYIGIEDDFIADIYNRGGLTVEELNDIIKTIRFNAMHSYFNTEERIDEYANTFFGFCEALTGTVLSGSSSEFTPLDAYRIMNESIYNFGCEAEPAMNLAIIKLMSTYKVCASLFHYVNFLNTGLPGKDRFDSINTAVRNELTSERLYHHNKNGYAFSLVTNSYMDARVNEYSLYLTCNYRTEWTAYHYIENVKLWMRENNRGAYDSSGFTYVTINEADFRFMLVKFQLINKVKGTNVSFKQYLHNLGIIPDELYEQTGGVLLSIDEFIQGEGCEALSLPEKLHMELTTDESTEDYTFWEVNEYKRDEDKEYDGRMAAKGKVYNFADGQEYNCIEGFYFFAGMGTAPGGWQGVNRAWVYADDFDQVWVPMSESLDCKISIEVMSYYVSFKPANV